MKKKALLLIFIGGFTLQQNTIAQIDLVYDIDPTGSSDPATFTEFQGNLYFSATVGTSIRRDLYVYDGENPPSIVSGLGTGDYGGVWPQGNYGVIGDKMYLTIDDGTVGTELYQYDGFELSLVADIQPGVNGSFPTDFTVHNEVLYFSAETESHGRELYKYTPSTNSCVRLSDLNPGSNNAIIPLNMFAKDKYQVWGNKLFLLATDASGIEKIFIYDIATNDFSALEVGAAPSIFPNKAFVLLNDEVYFIAIDAASGKELYKYNGDEQEQLTDLAPGPQYGVLHILGAYNGKVYVCGSTDGFNLQLYAYNPANNATDLVYTINPSGGAYPYDGIEYNGLFYFIAHDFTNGAELWATDGTTTQMVMDLYPGEEGSIPTYLTVFNGKLYMCADNGTSGTELFVLETEEEPISIQNVAYEGNIKLYPNPVSDMLTIKVEAVKDEKVHLEIYALNGRKVMTQTFNLKSGSQEFKVNIEELATGMYMYRISGYGKKAYQNGKMSKQ